MRANPQQPGRRLPALLPLLLLLLAPRAHALDVPALQGRVNDYANMISPAVRQGLETQLRDFEKTDSTQIVVLTVPSLQGEDLEGFSIKVAEAWKIGQRTVGGQRADNGAILLVARDDRAVRIEVGYGLEGRLTDLLSHRIIDAIIVPSFQAGELDQGFQRGVQAMIEAVRGEFKGTGRVSDEPAAGASSARGIGLFLPFLILYFIVSAIGARRRILGGIAGGVMLPVLAGILKAVGLLAIPLVLLAVLAPVGFLLGLLFGGFGRRAGRGPRRFGGGFPMGGGFGGGGFGGGGGGFRGGGGGFGGGGASGRW